MPSIPLATAREILEGTGLTVEGAEGGWTGYDVVGVVTWERPLGEEELERLPALRVVVPAESSQESEVGSQNEDSGSYSGS